MFDNTTKQYSDHPSILFWFGMVPYTSAAKRVWEERDDSAMTDVSWYPTVETSPEGTFWNDFIHQVNGERTS